MSWGYWGIVTGLLVMLVLFFVSMGILYRGSGKPMADAADVQAERDSKTVSSTKHAA